MKDDIRTPHTDPSHHTVGRRFTKSGESYYCDSYDPLQGYWMTNEKTGERRNVSERAIGSTFHQIHEPEKPEPPTIPS